MTIVIDFIQYLNALVVYAIFLFQVFWYEKSQY